MVQPSGSGGGIASLSAGDITSIVTQLQSALGEDVITRMINSNMFSLNLKVNFQAKRKAYFVVVV